MHLLIVKVRKNIVNVNEVIMKNVYILVLAATAICSHSLNASTKDGLAAGQTKTSNKSAAKRRASLSLESEPKWARVNGRLQRNPQALAVPDTVTFNPNDNEQMQQRQHWDWDIKQQANERAHINKIYDLLQSGKIRQHLIRANEQTKSEIYTGLLSFITPPQVGYDSAWCDAQIAMARSYGRKFLPNYEFQLAVLQPVPVNLPGASSRE